MEFSGLSDYTGKAGQPANPPPMPPGMVFALSLAAGIFLSSVLHNFWLMSAGALAVLAALRIMSGPSRRKLWLGSSVIIAVVFTGAVVFRIDERVTRMAAQQPPFDSQYVLLTGEVLESSWRRDTSYGRDRAEFILQVRSQRSAAWKEPRLTDYRVLVSVNLGPGEDFSLRGDELLAVLGRLERLSGFSNPGGFDWREYQAQRLVAARARVDSPADITRLESGKSFLSLLLSPSILARTLRARLHELHRRLYPDPAVRSIVSAMLTGTRHQLPRPVRDDFVRSGSIHVLVVSGLHAGLVATVVFLPLALLLGRGLAASLAASLAVFLFALVGGARPSVIRAAILCAAVLLAAPLRRRTSLLNILAAAFALMLLVRPAWLFDAGFQLSFAAVAGIVLLVPPVEERFYQEQWWRNTVLRYLVRLALACTAAQLAVAPLLLYHFHRISPVAFAANPVIVPLAAVTVTGAFVNDILAFLWLAAADFFSLRAITPLVRTMAGAARWFAGFEWSSLRAAAPPFYHAAFFWAVLLLTVYAAAGRLRKPLPLIAALVWLNTALWWPLPGASDSAAVVRFLDMGDSQMPFVHLPEGRTLAFDPVGRGATGGFELGNVIVPYVYGRAGGNIEWLVVRGSEPRDFILARRALEMLPVGKLVLAGGDDGMSRELARLLTFCRHREIPVLRARAGNSLSCGGTAVRFEGPGDHAQGAGCLLPVLRCNGWRVVFSGHLGARETERLAGLCTEKTVAELPSSLTAFDNIEQAHDLLESYSGEFFVAAQLPRILDGMDAGGARVLETVANGALSVELTESGLRCTGNRTGLLVDRTEEGGR